MKKLTIKVQLEGIKPTIWREFQVPSEMSADDFGDDWDHSLKITHTEEYAKGGRKCAKILAGARCCPPEDIGGKYGYQEMLQVLKKNPHSEEAEGYYMWLGGPFNPERFSIREIASDLAFYRMHHCFPGPEEE